MTAVFPEPMSSFADLVKSVCFGDMPITRTSFCSWNEEAFVYDVCVVDVELLVTVVMPKMAVLLHIACTNPNFSPEMPSEHAEAYIQNYKVRGVDALAFALTRGEDLVALFGSRYDEARLLASGWWDEALAL